MKTIAMAIAILLLRILGVTNAAANLVSNRHLMTYSLPGARGRCGLGAIATLLMVSLSGCGTTGILSSNLDHYQDGANLELVGSNIPGPPEGDRVENVLPVVVVTSGGTNLMNGNKLRVNGRVDYRPMDHEVPDRYQIVWRGLRDNHSATPTQIRLQDANGRNAVVLRFEGGNLIVRSADQQANPQPVFATNRVHEVSVIIDMQYSKSVRVEIVEIVEGEEDKVLFTPFALGLLDADFSSLHAVQFESASGVNYFVQDLRVLAN